MPEEPVNHSTGVDQVFPEITDEAALACCPEIIQELVAALGHRQAVVATALATAATAIGPKLVVSSNGRKTPALFNLGVVHDHPRSLPWFDALTAPLLSGVLQLEAALSRDGLAWTRKDIAERKAELERARKTIGPDPDHLTLLEADYRRQEARLKPFVLTSRLDYQSLAQAIPQAFDHGVTVISAGTDPGDQLVSLKRPERSRVAELLNRSWAGQLLSFGTATYSGTVTILFQTRKPVKELITRGFEPAFTAVPILLLESGGSRIPALSSEAKWKGLIQACFNHRLLNCEKCYTCSPEAQAVFDDFATDLEDKISGIPVPWRPHLSWVAELPQRIALTLWILEAGDTVLTVEVAEKAVVVTWWLGRQHLRAVAAALTPDGPAVTDRAVPMLAKIRIKQPLTRRELWKSYDCPKAAWFEPALECLLSSNKVAYNDAEQLVTSN